VEDKLNLHVCKKDAICELFFDSHHAAHRRWIRLNMQPRYGVTPANTSGLPGSPADDGPDYHGSNFSLSNPSAVSL